jgi:hypothetical protein
MCNEYGNRIPYRRYVEEFSHLKLKLTVAGNGPDLTARDEIRIRDTAPVILRTGAGVELSERTWAPRGPTKKPVFNFRSDKRSFAKSTRCLIPASHFVEFTAPSDPKQKTQGQVALHAGRRRVVLHRRHHPSGRRRPGALFHHVDDRAGSGRCALSRPAGRGAAAAGLGRVARSQPERGRAVAPARAGRDCGRAPAARISDLVLRSLAQRGVSDVFRRFRVTPP